MNWLDKNGKRIIIMNVIPDPTILVKTFDDPNWAVGFKPHGCEILTVIESLFLIFDIRLENAWKPAVVKSQPPMRIFPRILCVPKASAGGGDKLSRRGGWLAGRPLDTRSFHLRLYSYTRLCPSPKFKRKKYEDNCLLLQH